MIRPHSRLHCALLAISLFFLLLLARSSYLYLRMPFFLDHFEPHIACVAHRIWLGYPIYHAPDAPDRYSTILGPNIYLWNALLQGPHPRSFADAKIPGIAACWAAMLLTGFAAWRRFGILSAIIACGIIAMIGLIFDHYAYWNRSDPLLMLALSIGVAGVLAPREVPGAILLGAALGLAFNVKFHAVLYFIPLFPLIGTRFFRWKAFGAGIATLAVSIVLPFMLPGVQIRNYLAWLGMIRQGEAVGQDLLMTALMLAVFSLPIAGLLLTERARRRTWLFCWFLPVALTFLATMNYGLEKHHVMPLAIGIAIIILLWMNERKTLLAWLLLSLFFGSAGIYSFLQWSATQNNIQTLAKFSPIEKDFRKIVADTEGLQRAMGYAGLLTYIHSQARILMVFGNDNVLYLDAPAMMDHRKAGVLMPQATIDAVREKRVDLWLIPRGGPPWSIHHFYRKDWELFPEEFKEAFRNNYRFIGRTEHYALWLALGKELPKQINLTDATAQSNSP